MKVTLHSLGLWTPELPTEGEFIKFLANKNICDVSSITYRDPQWYKNNHLDLDKYGYDNSADVWHRDNGDSNIWVIVWTNTTPTELKPARRLRPNYVYAFCNRSFLHRTPPSVLKRANIQRYFLRAYHEGAINAKA